MDDDDDEDDDDKSEDGVVLEDGEEEALESPRDEVVESPRDPVATKPEEKNESVDDTEQPAKVSVALVKATKPASGEAFPVGPLDSIRQFLVKEGWVENRDPQSPFWDFKYIEKTNFTVGKN